MDKIEIKGKKVFEGEKKLDCKKLDNKSGGCDYCPQENSNEKDDEDDE